MCRFCNHMELHAAVLYTLQPSSSNGFPLGTGNSHNKLVSMYVSKLEKYSINSLPKLLEIVTSSLVGTNVLMHRLQKH
jgi:hypothetical protein